MVKIIRNLVAKHARKYNKSNVMLDKKKQSKIEPTLDENKTLEVIREESDYWQWDNYGDK